MAITTVYEIQADESYALHPAVYKVVRDGSEVYSKTLAIDTEVPEWLMSPLILEIKGFVTELATTIPDEPHMTAETAMILKKSIRALTYLADVLPDAPITQAEEGQI